MKYGLKTQYDLAVSQMTFSMFFFFYVQYNKIMNAAVSGFRFQPQRVCQTEAAGTQTVATGGESFSLSRSFYKTMTETSCFLLTDFLLSPL